jgi:hypothetical protein
MLTAINRNPEHNAPDWIVALLGCVGRKMECVVKEARREQTGATLEKIRRYPLLEPNRGGMGPQRSDVIALLALAQNPNLLARNNRTCLGVLRYRSGATRLNKAGRTKRVPHARAADLGDARTSAL